MYINKDESTVGFLRLVREMVERLCVATHVVPEMIRGDYRMFKHLLDHGDLDPEAIPNSRKTG